MEKIYSFFENYDFSFERLQALLAYQPQEPMLFSSGLFLILFVLFLPLYYLLRKTKTARIIYVVLFSLFFYYKSSGIYFLLLILTSTVDFILGSAIYKAPNKGVRKLYVVLSLAFNLGMLGYIKYTNLLVESFVAGYNGFLNLLGSSSATLSATPMDIFLPVGISFFTFQSMSYVLDLYRGEVKPLKRWIDYLFYVSFFPQLVAGPIVRAKDFIPQIHRVPFVSKAEFGEGLFLILSGVMKKTIISDYISLNFVDRIFDAPTLYTGFENLMGIYGYALQIYCDFSGYSDIAIGIALWLGFRFNINFDSPYRSATITEFWRRWHISLSTWLKDYLYISLGGNRKGRLRTYVNLIITMFLGGLWHGANIRFIIWGLLHGVALAIHKMMLQLLPSLKKTGEEMPRFRRYIGMFITFHLVCIGWVFFRASSMEVVSSMFSQIVEAFHPEVIGQFIVGYKTVFILIVIGYLVHFVPQKPMDKLTKGVAALPLWAQALLFALVIVLVVQFRSSGVQPFIYFQF